MGIAMVASISGAAVLGMVAGLIASRVAQEYSQGIASGAVPDAILMQASIRRACRVHAGPALGFPHLAAMFVLAVLAIILNAQHGWGLKWSIYLSALAVLWGLASIDLRTRLLPDALTQPLLWMGLTYAWWQGAAALHQSLAGVALGWGLLWTLNAMYLMVRGRPGVGGGDVKMLAALGAWAGWQGLPSLLLLASLLSVLVAMLAQGGIRLRGAQPFGPYLSLAAGPVFLSFPGLNSWFW